MVDKYATMAKVSGRGKIEGRQDVLERFFNRTRQGSKSNDLRTALEVDVGRYGTLTMPLGGNVSQTLKQAVGHTPPILFQNARNVLNRLNDYVAARSTGLVLGMGPFGAGGKDGYKPLFKDHREALHAFNSLLLNNRTSIFEMINDPELEIAIKDGPKFAAQDFLKEVYYWLERNSGKVPQVGRFNGPEGKEFLKDVAMRLDNEIMFPLFVEVLTVVASEGVDVIESYSGIATLLAKYIVNAKGDVNIIFDKEGFFKKEFMLKTREGLERVTGAALLAKFVQLREEKMNGSSLKGLSLSGVLQKLGREGIREVVSNDVVVIDRRRVFSDGNVIEGFRYGNAMYAVHLLTHLVEFAEKRTNMREMGDRILSETDPSTGLIVRQLWNNLKLAFILMFSGHPQVGIEQIFYIIGSDVIFWEIIDKAKEEIIPSLMALLRTPLHLESSAQLLGFMKRDLLLRGLGDIRTFGGDLGRKINIDGGVIDLRSAYSELASLLVREQGRVVVNLRPNEIIKDMGDEALTLGYNFFHKTYVRYLSKAYLSSVIHHIVPEDFIMMLMMLARVIKEEGEGDVSYLKRHAFLWQEFTTREGGRILGSHVLARLAMLDRKEKGDAEIEKLDVKARVAALGGDKGILDFATNADGRNPLMYLAIKYFERGGFFEAVARREIGSNIDAVLSQITESMKGRSWEDIKKREFFEGRVHPFNEPVAELLGQVIQHFAVLDTPSPQNRDRLLTTPLALVKNLGIKNVYEEIMRIRRERFFDNSTPQTLH